MQVENKGTFFLILLHCIRFLINYMLKKHISSEYVWFPKNKIPFFLNGKLIQFTELLIDRALYLSWWLLYYKTNNCRFFIGMLSAFSFRLLICQWIINFIWKPQIQSLFMFTRISWTQMNSISPHSPKMVISIQN